LRDSRSSIVARLRAQTCSQADSTERSRASDEGRSEGKLAIEDGGGGMGNPARGARFARGVGPPKTSKLRNEPIGPWPAGTAPRPGRAGPPETETVQLDETVFWPRSVTAYQKSTYQFPYCREWFSFVQFWAVSCSFGQNRAALGSFVQLGSDRCSPVQPGRASASPVSFRSVLSQIVGFGCG